MKRVEIYEDKFIQMMKIVKHCIARDDTRPVLKFIKLSVAGKTLTAYALDGYRASKVEIELESEFEEFACYIKPIAIKASKNALQKVSIEYDGEHANIEIPTDYGKLKYTFDQPNSDFIDVEKIYKDSREHDREHAINPVFLAEAAKALAEVSIGNHCAVIESKSNIVQPIIIRAKGEGIKSEQLILPMRTIGNEDR